MCVLLLWSRKCRYASKQYLTQYLNSQVWKGFFFEKFFFFKLKNIFVSIVKSPANSKSELKFQLIFDVDK